MRKLFGAGKKEPADLLPDSTSLQAQTGGGANDTTSLQANQAVSKSSDKSDAHEVKSSRLGRMFGGAKQIQKVEVIDNTGDLIGNTSGTTTALPTASSPQVIADSIDPLVKTGVNPNIKSSSTESKNIEVALGSFDDREQPDERKKAISFTEGNDPNTPDSKKERGDKHDIDDKNQSDLDDYKAEKVDVKKEPLADSKISTTADEKSGTEVLKDRDTIDTHDNDADGTSSSPSKIASLSAFGSRMSAGFSQFGRRKGTDSSIDSSTHSVDSDRNSVNNNVAGKDSNEKKFDKGKDVTTISSTNADTATTATAPIAADSTNKQVNPTEDIPPNSSVDVSPSKLISNFGSRMSAGFQQFGRRKLVDSSVVSSESKSGIEPTDSSTHDDTAEIMVVKGRNENESESDIGKENSEDVSMSSRILKDSDLSANPEIQNVPKPVAPLYIPLQCSLLLLDVGTVIEALYGVGFEWFPGVIKEVILPQADVPKVEAIPLDVIGSSNKIKVDKKSKLKDFMNVSKKNMVEDLNKDKSNDILLEKETMYSIVYDDGDKEICSRVKIRVPSRKESQPGKFDDDTVYSDDSNSVNDNNSYYYADNM
jgi:hypothetical protein